MYGGQPRKEHFGVVCQSWQGAGEAAHPSSTAPKEEKYWLFSISKNSRMSKWKEQKKGQACSKSSARQGSSLLCWTKQFSAGGQCL